MAARSRLLTPAEMIAARSFPLGVVGDSFLDFDDDGGDGLAFLRLEVGVFVGVGES